MFSLRLSTFSVRFRFNTGVTPDLGPTSYRVDAPSIPTPSALAGAGGGCQVVMPPCELNVMQTVWPVAKSGFRGCAVAVRLGYISFEVLEQTGARGGGIRV